MRSKENGKRERRTRQATLSARSEYGELGAWLKSVRLDQRIGQRELSRKMQKPELFLSKVESGKQRIDLVEFYDFVRALHPQMKLTFNEFLASLNSMME